jgi:diguanylate cyclase (GGDEF)-like protein/PAS domain S-box-containing protein
MNKLTNYLNQSPTIFFILKKENNIWELEYVTENVINIYGFSAEDFLSKKIKHEDFIFPDDLKSFRAEAGNISSVINDEYIYEPYRILNKDKTVWIKHITKIIRDKNGKRSHYYGYLTDITDEKELYHKLEVKSDHLKQYIKIVNENVFITMADKYGNIIDISDAYCTFTGYKKEELIGKKHNIFKHPDNDSYVFKELWKTITKGIIWRGEHLNIKKNGNPFWVENSITPNVNEDNEIIGYTSIYNDITDKKEISELLITDYLTKIYNRRHFNTVFELERKRSKRAKNNLILMILDIDFFKQYNDTYGHDAGDNVLHDVSQALKNTLKRAEDFVFRLGGEEFGIITSNIDKEGVLSLAKRLRESILNLKIEHKSSEVNAFLTISVGIKIVQNTSTITQTDIYKLADEALYKAKETGRNKSVICTREQL